MQKIQRTSRVLSYFFHLVSWLLPLPIAYFILFNLKALFDWGFFALMLPDNAVSHVQNFSFGHRLIILVIQLLPVSMTVLICNRLSRLFKLYEQGDLFDEKTIKLVKQIGMYMLIGQLLELIYQPLMTIALTFTNEVGKRMMSISLGSANFSTVITAVIIIVASWILQEANFLKKEAQLTI